MALTAKQAAFVQEYLVDLNATQAAIRAGYSQRRAGEIGYQLLQKTTVQEAIKAAMDERGDRTHITQDFVLAELYKIATQGADDGPESSLKYSNKLKALELLGKHMAMFTDKVDSKVDGVMRIELSPELEELAE